MQSLTEQPNFLLYTSPNGDVRLEVFLQNETIWLTQKMMAELFDVESHTITYHIGEIYKTAELGEKLTHRRFRAVQEEDRAVDAVLRAEKEAHEGKTLRGDLRQIMKNQS